MHLSVLVRILQYGFVYMSSVFLASYSQQQLITCKQLIFVRADFNNAKAQCVGQTVHFIRNATGNLKGEVGFKGVKGIKGETGSTNYSEIKAVINNKLKDRSLLIERLQSKTRS